MWRSSSAKESPFFFLRSASFHQPCHAMVHWLQRRAMHDRCTDRLASRVFRCRGTSGCMLRRAVCSTPNGRHSSRETVHTAPLHVVTGGSTAARSPPNTDGGCRRPCMSYVRVALQQFRIGLLCFLQKNEKRAEY